MSGGWSYRVWFAFIGTVLVRSSAVFRCRCKPNVVCFVQDGSGFVVYHGDGVQADLLLRDGSGRRDYAWQTWIPRDGCPDSRAGRGPA